MFTSKGIGLREWNSFVCGTTASIGQALQIPDPVHKPQYLVPKTEDGRSSVWFCDALFLGADPCVMNVIPVCSGTGPAIGNDVQEPNNILQTGLIR
jgi:hypothetical protein